jgi:hypothetical protein
MLCTIIFVSTTDRTETLDSRYGLGHCASSNRLIMHRDSTCGYNWLIREAIIAEGDIASRKKASRSFVK